MKIVSVFFMLLFVICSSKTTKVESILPIPESPSGEDIPIVFGMPYAEGQQVREEPEPAHRALPRPIYFCFDCDMVSESVSEFSKYVKDYPGNYVIEGNCDNRGSDDYNYRLGLRRAFSVLKAMGYPENVVGVSNGEFNPAEKNCYDEKCHALNRRVELKQLPKKGKIDE
jgi:outer membrane protein OmpA-like peptidoglycan-associated protein